MWEKYTRFNTEPLSLEGLFGTCRIVEVCDGDVLKIVAQVFPDEFRVVTLRLGVPADKARMLKWVLLRWLDPELFADDDDVQAKLDSTPVIAVVECFGQDEYGRELARLHNDRGCINDILSS
jgi:hypothetical protein